jgi:hypothetical protein
MKRLERFVRPAGILLAVISVLVILGFVERAADGTLIQDVRVHVKGNAGIHFIDESTVRSEIMDQGPAVLGRPVSEVDMPSIENRLRALPAVSNAEVYHTMDGTMHVKVEQRVPIVRVFNSDGYSFSALTLPRQQLTIDQRPLDPPTSRAFVDRLDLDARHPPRLPAHIHPPRSERERQRRKRRRLQIPTG